MDLIKILFTFFICLLKVSADTKPETVMIDGVPAMVTTSSELASKTPGAYSVRNLFDRDNSTAWAEGVNGNGKGEWIEIAFSKEVLIEAISIKPGYIKNEKSFMENTVPQTINLKTDKENIGNFTINYNTEYNVNASKYGAKYCTQSASPINYKVDRLLVFSSPKRCKKIIFTIVKVLDGETRFSDLCITELMPILNSRDSSIKQVDSSLIFLTDWIKNNKIEKLIASANIVNLDTVYLQNDISIASNHPAIGFAEVIQKRIDNNFTVVFDTTFLKKPQSVPRLKNSSCNGKTCFFNTNLVGFVNTFVSVFKDKESIFLIGDWTVRYSIETDEAWQMARFPVVRLKNNNVLNAFEVPVTLGEGECSNAPEIKQLFTQF
jgi:hypothetical protein